VTDGGGRRGVVDVDDAGLRNRDRTGSRPRSKRRPSHDDAVTATVVAVDRGRFTCRPDGDGALVTAAKARELGRRSVVVGDRVELVGDVTGAEGSLARLVRVRPRRSVLRRTADDADPVERVIVANADQLAVVTAVTNPEPNLRLIDRCLVAAYDGGIDPVLVVTKTDLADPAALLAAYRPLGVPMVALHRGGSVQPITALLARQVTVLVGPSGVGKSTLVNRLVPDAARSTGAVNAVTGRGRHVSTSAVALTLPDGLGTVIDTPGVRSFGLAHVDRRRVMHAFGDLEAGTTACPRACDHRNPDCALDAWVAAGEAPAERLASLRRLLDSLEAQDQY
jgi:ribosome biogenesis GTPase